MREIIGAALLALLGLAALLFGTDLSMGQVRVPGSGALPRFSGAIVLLLAVTLSVRGVRALKRGAAARRHDGILASMPDSAAVQGKATVGAGMARIAAVVLLIATYAWALPRAGYLLTTACVMTALFAFAQPPRRWVTPVLGVTATVLTYLLFHLLLNVPLPRGSWWAS